MSLFIASRAFGRNPLLHAAKLENPTASVMACIVGWLVLARASRPSVE